MPYQRKLGWSPSRAAHFQSCGRRYWFEYYGHWQDPDPVRRDLLLRLKRTSTIPLMTGGVVHDLATNLLRYTAHGNSMDGAVLKTNATARMKARWNDSLRTAKAPLAGDPYRDSWFLLLEHYLARQHGENSDCVAQMTSRKERVWDCLESLRTSQLVSRDLAERRVRFLPLPGGRFPKFYWNGIEIICKPDALIETRDAPTIYDWKTGQAGADASLQLTTYARWAEADRGIAATDVQVCAADLTRPETHWQPLPIAREQLDNWNTQVTTSYLAMRAVLTDEDPQRNQALPESAFKPSPTVGKCKLCAFRTECSEGAGVVAAASAQVTLHCVDEEDEEFVNGPVQAPAMS